MKTTDRARDNLFRDYAKLFSASAVKNLTELGLDILEARREGPYVWDSEGTKYIDCNTSDGTFNLGRRPPELASALLSAMRETDQGNFPMISREKGSLAESLADFVSGSLECSFFSVVRGEAFEFACKLSRGFTGRKELVGIEGSYFGEMGFGLSLSTRPDKAAFGPLIPETVIAPFDGEAARGAVTHRTAALMFEPVQAENHCRMMNPDRYRALRDHCRGVGALFIVDETQSGFGRTGRKFAFERLGDEPDVLIVGEALGGGMFPITATVYTQRINAFMNSHPLIHLSTFGGSDLGCEVARKALDLYRDAKPWRNAAAMGAALKEGLEDVAGRRGKLIKSVAGEGLLLSLELTDENLARAFVKNLTLQGVLASPGKIARNTVVLRPALTISQNDVKTVVDAADAAAVAMLPGKTAQKAGPPKGKR